METILLLAHTEADGSLGKPALEALAAAVGLGGALTVGLVGAATQAAADQIAGVRRGTLPRGHGRGVRTTPLCDRCGRRRGPVPGGGLPDRDRRRELAVGAGPARSGVPAGRPRGHACDRPVALANGAPALTRWFYRQRMEAVLARTQRPWVVLLDRRVRGSVER